MIREEVKEYLVTAVDTEALSRTVHDVYMSVLRVQSTPRHCKEAYNVGLS